jgi:hypothetical protein
VFSKGRKKLRNNLKFRNEEGTRKHKFEGIENDER